MNPYQLTRNLKSLNRLRHIATTLTQHGFGHIVAQVDLSRFVPVWMIRQKPKPTDAERIPSAIGKRIARVCSELGPTFIKLGQFLSTRSDIVPEDVITELRGLHDSVPPFESAEAMAIIEQALGRPIEACFTHIEQQPVASGSIGQVHQATALDGTGLMVKIRRPHIDEIIELDIQLLRWLAESVESMAPELRGYQPKLLVDELEQLLMQELDYINEASTTERFRAAFVDDPKVSIPKVYWPLTAPQVLTLEKLNGTNVESSLAGGRAQDVPARRGIAQTIAECYLKQVFEMGEFHTDPHPGNILATYPDHIGLIDFGQSGKLSDEFITDLVVLVYACVNREMELVVDTLFDLGAVGPNINQRHLQQSLERLLDKYYGLPLKRLELPRLLQEFIDVTRRHEILLPREMARLLKALGTVAGVIVRLDPDLDLLRLIEPRLKTAIKTRLSPLRLSRSGARLGLDLMRAVRKAPRQLRSLMRRVGTGVWQLNVKHENLDRMIKELDRSSNRLASSIVLAAIIISSSVVVSAPTELAVFGFKVQYFGIVGYVLAGVLGLGLTWAIFRSGRLH